MRINEVVMLNEINLSTQHHGIPEVVIWVGPTGDRHGPRIKVSNVKNHYAKYNNFTIEMPIPDYNPAEVEKWVRDYIPQIKEWMSLNADLIYDVINKKITNNQFKASIVKV